MEGNRSRGRPRGQKKEGQGSVAALEKAITVLQVLSRAKGLSLTELSQRADLPTATAYRILTTLEAKGVVHFEDAAQLWSIGIEAFRIGSAFLSRTDILEESRPVMQALSAEVNETANLAILDGTEVVFVSQVETDQPIRAFFRPGTRGRVHASGIGKALLAFSEESVRERIVSSAPLDGFTQTTITNREALKLDLSAIRARGFAIDNEERTVGMRCIAAPIFDQTGRPVAGISVSGPSVRMPVESDDNIGAAVKRAASEISQAIGGTPPMSNGDN
ncbi:MAG: HTH-type transcriptional regulator BhcR [Pseudomonadota bacterium]